MKIPLFEIDENTRLTPEHYLAVRSDGLTFAQALGETVRCPEIVAQVDRLYGTCILKRGSPIKQMIDEACGKDDADMQTFLRFVWNCIFIRCPDITK